MNYPLHNPGQVRAAAGLAEVADRYGRVAVISRATGGTTALLDQTAYELSQRRMRCVRVQGPASGGLALRGLIAQLIGRDPGALTGGALTDGDLKAGFMALTDPGQGYDRVALLVAEAHGLLPSAARYIQLACQSSPTKLCVVLAGQPSLAAVLAGDGLAHLRGAMHVMELPEPAEPGLFDPVPAMPEPRAMPVVSRQAGSSSLARLGLAALIVPIVGLIWWRHLPATPTLAVPAQVAPVLSNIDLPAAEASPLIPADRAGEPAPSAPDRTAMPQAEAAVAAEPVPAPPDTTPAASVPEPPVPELAAQPDPPEETRVTEGSEPSAAAPGRSEPPTQQADLAEPPATPAPPVPDPAAASEPQPPHGTLTVTSALQPRRGARRAAPLASPASLPARAVEDRPSPAEDHRCRDIVLKAQLGRDPSDADTQFLRNGCRGN